jgi:glutamate synthase (NADPH) large chain
MSPQRPGPTGLYSPESEHDACGVSFVVDLHGRRSHELVQGLADVAVQPRAPRRHRRRGEHGRRRRHPHPGARRVPARRLDVDLPAAGSYATGIAFLPVTTPRRADALRRRSARSATPRASPSSPGATPTDPSGRATRRSARHALVPAPRHRAPDGSVGHRPRPAGLPGPQAHRARGPRRRRRAVRLLPVAVSRTIVYKGMLTTPQLGEFFPTCPTSGSTSASRSCTRGSRPTPSRRGRSRTRTASSPTTARSTPSRATELDARPRGAARSTCSPATSSASSRSAPRAPPTPLASTRRSSCCTSAATRCPTPCS